MSLWVLSLIMLAVALVMSSMGFYKFVYFISVGYGAAIAGLGVALMVIFRENLNLPSILLCALLVVYGIRLSGYLVYRELKSVIYRDQMKREVKDTTTMKFPVKCMLWISCALLYVLMASPVALRFFNGDFAVDTAYIIGVAICVFGLVLESASDLAKSRFKKTNPDKICKTGLYSIVRCPNYLGEMLIWTGFLVAGVSSFCSVAQWIIAIVGYIGIIFVMFSGARRREEQHDRRYGEDPEYQKYAKTVPILLPFVPLYSLKKYKFLVF
ncbi:MAG: DUF1295 domain-containing protein [Bacteroidales bacterium]|nr:DUF1295 domain-containing protein [Bacteroidales bacterium]